MPKRMRLSAKLNTITFLLLLPFFLQAAITKGPYLVHPEQTSMTIMWESDNSQSASINYGTTVGMTQKLTVQPFADKDDFYLYKVTLDNLSPDSKYYYKVKLADGAEHTSFFKTNPSAKSEITFIAIGDSRTGHDVYRTISKDINSYSPGLVISMGDLVGTGSHFNEWGPHYFQPASHLIDHIPLISTLGDHDERSDGAQTFFYFFCPGKTAEHIWFSFDYGPAHFVSLDFRGEKDPAMMEWFKKDMVASKAKWKFVYMHRPSYNVGGHRSNWGRGVWPQLFREYQADIVFAGHSHMYERFFPMRPSSEPNSWPVTFITTGGAGAELYESVPNKNLAKTESKNNLLLFHISGDTLELKALYTDKTVFDKFKMIKTNGHYDDAYLSLVHPEEDMDAYMLFASRLELRFHEKPTLTKPAKVELSFPPSDLGQDISFEIRLSGESALHYRIKPIKGVIKKDVPFKGTIELFAKGNVSRKGRYFDPPVLFEARYKTSFTSGVAKGRESRYYPAKK